MTRLNDFVKFLVNTPQNKLLKMSKSSWELIVKRAKEKNEEEKILNLVNKAFKKNYKNLDIISKDIVSESIVNNSKKNLDELFLFLKRNLGFIALADFLLIFPSFFYINNLVGIVKIWKLSLLFVIGKDYVIAALALYWLAIITGSFKIQWKQYKKDHPEKFKQITEKIDYLLG